MPALVAGIDVLTVTETAGMTRNSQHVALHQVQRQMRKKV
jgi:hypothetical protein